MAQTDRLVAMAGYYTATFSHSHVPAPPALGTAVVTCMDARINVYGLFGLAEGDSHVLRTAGGSATDDVLRSLAVSQRKLGTREVLVVQHTGCGLTGFDGAAFRDQIARETGVAPVWSETGTFDDLEQNVRDSVARIQGDPSLLHRDSVRGFVYDVFSGTLREVLPLGHPGAPAQSSCGGQPSSVQG